MFFSPRNLNSSKEPVVEAIESLKKINQIATDQSRKYFSFMTTNKMFRTCSNEPKLKIHNDQLIDENDEKIVEQNIPEELTDLPVLNQGSSSPTSSTCSSHSTVNEFSRKKLKYYVFSTFRSF